MKKCWEEILSLFQIPEPVIAAAASSSAVYQFLCAYTGAALAEFFMFARELPSFLMLDDFQEKYSLFIQKVC